MGAAQSVDERDAVYGDVSGWGLVFIQRSRAVELAAFYRAIERSKTWGEMKTTLVPESPEYERLTDDLESWEPDEVPADSAEWSGPDDFPGFSDFGGPFAPTEMLQWVPESIVKRYGKVTLADGDSDWVYFPSELESQILAAFRETGYECARDDGLVRAAMSQWA